MKKVITVLISLLMILSLAACGNSASQTRQPSTEEKPAAGTMNSEKPAENTDISEGQTNESENPENPDIPEEQGTKVLVAYFSATNTTEGVAEHIANGLNADIYEIVPEEPYTDADLNYNDNNSRTTIEMNDPDARPAISGSVEDMEQYDIVFIGYPNWWYSAPMAVFSFLEENDLSGKRVVLFCSHGTGGTDIQCEGYFCGAAGQ